MTRYNFLYGHKTEIDQMDYLRDDVDYVSGGCSDQIEIEIEDEIVDEFEILVDEEFI